jgi:hypothetical protein
MSLSVLYACGADRVTLLRDDVMVGKIKLNKIKKKKLLEINHIYSKYYFSKLIHIFFNKFKVTLEFLIFFTFFLKKISY